MAEYAVQSMYGAGILPTFNATTPSDVFRDDLLQRTFLWVKNGNAGSRTVTVLAQQTSVDARGLGIQAIGNVVVSIAAGSEAVIGPFPKAFINDLGLVTVEHSGPASVTAAAVRLSPSGRP